MYLQKPATTSSLRLSFSAFQASQYSCCSQQCSLLEKFYFQVHVQFFNPIFQFIIICNIIINNIINIIIVWEEQHAIKVMLGCKYTKPNMPIMTIVIVIIIIIIIIIIFIIALSWQCI